MSWYKKAQINYAIHLTDERSANNILSTGKFEPSLTGWNGPGLYAHLKDPGDKGEGKGDIKILFSYDHLKISNGDKPEELDQEQWNILRVKNNRNIDKKLVELGYDGELINGEAYLRIFPESVYKIIPIRNSNELV
jgi:hypothetical protein